METYLLLGTNMGDREQFLHNAADSIIHCVGPITAKSSIYETESWGYNDNDYLNQVILCNTELSPSSLLERIHQIEAQMGRVRRGKGYEARPIDIDILLYGNTAIDTPSLTIPHKLMQERMFVLEPMCELEESLIHPVLNLSMGELRQNCTDKGKVKLYKKI